MTDSEKPPIKGYRKLSQLELKYINEGKELGSQIESYLKKIALLPLADEQCLEFATKDLKQGMMWATRAIARPDNF